jgi:PDZ domain-containing secreted protein
VAAIRGEIHQQGLIIVVANCIDITGQACDKIHYLLTDPGERGDFREMCTIMDDKEYTLKGGYVNVDVGLKPTFLAKVDRSVQS